MKKNFKDHLTSLKRIRTSLGRDTQNGLCLDRNERVTPFSNQVLTDLASRITPDVLSCYPEPGALYQKLSTVLDISTDSLYLTNGISEAIRVFYETLTSPGDQVVVVDPTFPMYKVYAEAFQVHYQPVPFRNDLSLDLDALYSSITEETAFVALPNPNLPIESYLPPDEVQRLAAHCLSRNCFLIADEAYGFFGAESMIPHIAEFENLIVTQTFSKAFGLAGIRLGYVVSQADNVEYLAKTRSLVESNGLSLAVGEYMIENPQIMTEYVEETRRGRDYLRDQLDQISVTWAGGDWTNALLIFLEDRKAVEDAVKYLRDRKIYVRASFEGPLTRCIRVTLGPEAAMRTFVQAFLEWRVTSQKVRVHG